MIKERDEKLQELASQNGLLEGEKLALRKELENQDKRSMVSSSQVNKRSAMAVGAGLDPEAAEEFKRVQAQNEDLKKQIEELKYQQ